MSSYGEIRYSADDGAWILTAEPHVLALVRRIFPRAGEQYGAVRITCTDDTCKDLEWLLLRYTLDFPVPAHRDRLYRRADAAESKRRAWRHILDGGAPRRSSQLAIPLRDYQRIAVEALLMQHSLLLADEVGVGKTAQGIGVISERSCRPAVVVAPVHLLSQWEREIARFAPHLTTHVVRRGRPYDVTIPPGKGVGTGDFCPDHPDHPDVMLLNYEKLAGWAETLARVSRAVVFDEVHELRHYRDGSPTAKAAAARHLAHGVAYRLGLSATPIFGYGSEFFNIVETLRPGALGTRIEFTNAWCEGSSAEKASIADPRAFGGYLRDQGIMLRRTRQDVGREIPPVQTIVQHVDADTAALDDFRSAAAELARVILRTDGRGAEKMMAAGQLNSKLRQLTGISKAHSVAAFVRMLVESGEKVLLYGWHHEVFDLWIERLRDLEVVTYTGRESSIQKEFARNRFIGRHLATGVREASVMIMSLRSGAGVDGLQAVCRTVVNGELDWSSAVHHQNVGRVARDGQTHPVAAYYAVSASGTDPIMQDVLGLKRAQLTGVLEPNRELIEQAAAVGESNAKRLARAYLTQLGEDVSSYATEED